MMPVSIDTANSRALDSIPEKCGAVTVGCTDVAGIVDKVIRSSEILRAAKADGTITLRESAVKKLAQGVTSFDEVLRVTVDEDMRR